MINRRPRVKVLPFVVMETCRPQIETASNGSEQFGWKVYLHFSQRHGEGCFCLFENVLKDLGNLFPRKTCGEPCLDEVSPLDFGDPVVAALSSPHCKLHVLDL